MNELLRKPYKITLWEDKNRNVYGFKPSYTIEKFGSYGWIESSISNPNSNIYDVYESTNQGQSRSSSIVKITFSGYPIFKIFIRSCAENSFDYTIASTLDATSCPTAYNSTTAQANTRDNQQIGINIDDYTAVTYNTDGGKHYIYIVFRKDGSGDIGDDKGYFIIEKPFSVIDYNTLKNKYLEEVCIATIGSDTMDTPIRAFNPILTEELNGSKTLTFQINYRYWDDEEEEFKLNPFINLLVNERKVKLKYDNNWYDFVIKQTDENSDSNTFTYTCKDLFINELGKTGYEVELDTELRNNMGTITELATSILRGTDWQVDEDNCDSLIQRNKEGLYSFVTNSSITATNILEGTSETIPSGKVILVFYSCKANKENPIQFLYKEQGNYSTVDEAIANFYKVDEYGFVIDANNYEFTYSGNLDNFYNSLISSSYFGQKIIKKQEMHYLPQIDETCTVWTHYYYDEIEEPSGNPKDNNWYEKNNNEYVLTDDTTIQNGKTYYQKNYQNDRYYCYKELEYASVAQVQNMLSNSSGFISTNGWVGDSNQDIVTLTTTGTDPILRSIGLNGNIYNTGFYDNRAALSPKGFIKGEKYIVAVKGITLTNNPYIILIGKTGVTNATPLTFNKEDNDQTYSFTIPSELENYNVKMAVCSETISYSSIINNYGDIRFYLNNNGNLVDCKVFKYRTDSTGKMIVPDLEQLYYKVVDPNGENPKNEGWYELSDGNYVLTTDTSIENGKDYYKKESPIIQTRYNFFLEESLENLGTIYTKQNLTIIESLLDTTTGYEPVMIDGCKKVTSITGSKSNRFNLIQSLCEAFECWAKFTIEHNDKGQIIYEYKKINKDEFVESGRYYQWTGTGSATLSSLDDTNFTIVAEPLSSDWTSYYKKFYHKYVTFKEYIGDDNPVGFRYGINLSSIQRNIISDQIASKVIVQANSNEFAPNGSCTIQQSVLNPTGENALYNFQYFINHGLLDATSLYDDLYGTNGGLGFYTKMKEYNDSIQPKINELSEISKSLYTLNSRQAVYDALLEEADRLYEDASLELSSAGYSSSGGTVPTYITELRNEMSSYQSTISYYSSLSTRNKSLLDAYTQKYNTISEQLASVRKLKDKLNQDFANKYYRFIQEGTWNSEDYWDPELYYQAANMVLYTSSFPQISYSINVLEISEIEGFEAYKFKIADKTYIEDTEFFGYDSKGRPYKEEIVVSQVTRHLDDNSQNTITVQNYKTQFQDLFQRIAATSQSLQYHEGAYQRAASAINSDGTINSALLQNSLEANALVIQNANNQSVTWDETGITISNFVNANEIVRLTSRGIVLSSNGGKDWTTGITGDGINADVITAGRIDTDRIRIFNKAMQQTFEWNSTGINAYMWDSSINGGLVDENNEPILGAVNYGKFVRFDQYGLYGYAGGTPNWSPGQSGITKVISDSIFSLTWKGLSINIPSGSQTDPVIRIGSSENPVFQVDANGNIILKGNIEWGDNKPTSTLVLYSNTKLNAPSSNQNYETYFSDNNNKRVKIETIGTYGWELLDSNTMTNPLSSTHDGVYRSKNQGKHDSQAVAKITFSGYDEFDVYIRSYAESSYDYTIASTLDANTYPTTSDSDTAKSSTKNNQQSGTSSNSYTKVIYSNISTSTHYIYVVFCKNGSTNTNDDSGYFLVPKSETDTWHKIYDSELDNYAYYSYDNGATWTEAMNVQVDSASLYNAITTNSNGKMGLFFNTDKGLCINANYITAGTISADYINGGTLSGVALSIGSNFSVTSTGVLTCSSATVTGTIKASDLQIKKNGSYQSIIKTINSAASSYALSLQDLKTDTLNLYTSSGTSIAGYIKVTGSSTSDFAVELHSNSAVRLSGASGSVYLSNSSHSIELTSGGTIATSATTIKNSSNAITISAVGSCTINCALVTKGNIRTYSVAPDADNSYTLGYGDYRWKRVNCIEASNYTTSDRREKNTIQYDLSQYDAFLKDLKPVSYKYNFEENGRIRFGFIAQDIEESLIKNNLNSNNLGFLDKQYDENKQDYIYGLVYGEFIALQQWQIQKLESRISALENLISSQNSDIL